MSHDPGDEHRDPPKRRRDRPHVHVYLSIDAMSIARCVECGQPWPKTRKP